MILVLRINGEPVKEWPLDYPKKHGRLLEKSYMEIREEYVQSVLEQAKAQSVELMAHNSYEFVIEVKASKQPKDFSYEASYKLAQEVSSPDPKVVKMERAPTNYSNVKY